MRVETRLILGVAAFCLSSVQVAAAPVNLDYTYSDLSIPHDPVSQRLTKQLNVCLRKPDTGHLERANCFSDEMSRQDQALNVAYRQVMLTLNPEQRVALRDAERAWIKEHTIYCNRQLTNSPDGGDGGCEVYETVRRTIWLEKLR